jgi:hypothetical protein
MPIVQHKLEQSVNANGSTSNILRMYDQDATPYMTSFSAPADFDVQALVLYRIAEMDEQLAENEFEQIVGGG